jgi:hypothetical protein
MCRTTTESGRRCPCDTSEARRYRRKASSLKKSVTATAPIKHDVTPVQPAPVSSIESLKTEADSLRHQLHNPPAGVSLAEHDSLMETKVTALGKSIALEAEKIAEYDDEAIKAQDAALREEYLGAINLEVQANNAISNETLDEWKEFQKRRGFKIKALDYINVHALEYANMTPEEEALVAKRIEIYEARVEVDDRRRIAREEYAKKAGAAFFEQNTKLTEAYKHVLSQIRPLGGDVKVSEESKPDAVDIMNETVAKDYPTEWLKYHNEADGENVVLKRARYGGRPGFAAQDITETVAETPQDVPPATIPLTGFSRESITELKAKLGPEVSFTEASYTDPKTGEEKLLVHVTAPTEEAYDPREHSGMLDGKPRGEGWVQKPTIYGREWRDGYRDAASVEALTKVQWVKKAQTEMVIAPSLETLSSFDADRWAKTSHYGTGDDLVKAVTYHEFGHRMESVFPDNLLARQEKAFLMRKTGKTEENFHSNLTVIPETNEHVHKGEFVDAYVGREYLNGSYEVFTTGVEAVYGKSFGGLVGNFSGFRNRDDEHRGFTLGVLASL